jgi:hypothetical protein
MYPQAYQSGNQTIILVKSSIRPHLGNAANRLSMDEASVSQHSYLPRADLRASWASPAIQSAIFRTSWFGCAWLVTLCITTSGKGGTRKKIFCLTCKRKIIPRKMFRLAHFIAHDLVSSTFCSCRVQYVFHTPIFSPQTQ